LVNAKAVKLKRVLDPKTRRCPNTKVRVGVNIYVNIYPYLLVYSSKFTICNQYLTRYLFR
jgi:hypothetical protein